MNMRAILIGCCVSVSLFAFSAESVAKTAITTAGAVAKAAINKNKSEVTMKDTKIDNNVNIKEGASIGNSGVSVKADKVKMTNVKIKNKVKIERAVSFGNSGVDIGK
jgi:NDP-sugar pyrophosphorylase family protein